MVIFADGSEQAYGCCVYVRWNVGEEEFESRLLAAKKRIAPKRVITVPRLELCSAVLSIRLRKNILSGMNFQFSKILHIVDSSIVYSHIQKESRGFTQFTANRIGEIQ